MKKHAIIPIFIPHRGCSNACVFCNQHRITARADDVQAEDSRAIIDEWLSTLGNVQTVELAFYGGSFTGLPISEQSVFLAVAEEYKAAGRIDKIHLSTRPDYIKKSILDNLKAHGVDTIELGVQSFDDEVLRRSKRGHDSAAVYRACDLIKAYGFELGIQLMIGLPGDSMESCVSSAEKAAAIEPELARLYPTLVLDDTELYQMYRRGEYTPLSRGEAVTRTKEMYRILDNAGITIMRVGLKSNDIIGDGGSINEGAYHPSFRQLVESEIARERVEDLLASVDTGKADDDAAHESRLSGSAAFPADRTNITIYSNSRWFSNLIGNKGVNKSFFLERYPQYNILYSVDKTLADGAFRIECSP